MVVDGASHWLHIEQPERINAEVLAFFKTAMAPDRYATEAISASAQRVTFEDLDGDAADRLKRSLLDAVGCAIGAPDAPPVVAIRSLVDEFDGRAATAATAETAAPAR